MQNYARKRRGQGRGRREENICRNVQKSVEVRDEDEKKKYVRKCTKSVEVGDEDEEKKTYAEIYKKM